MKHLYLALAAGTAFTAPIAAAHGSSTPIQSSWGMTAMTVVGGLQTGSGNASRPRRVPGETFLISGSYGSYGSSGQVGIGDIAVNEVKASSSFSSDLKLGLALALGAKQAPVERGIQQIVSKNYEAYWD